MNLLHRFLSFISSLTPHQFDVFKILLDKGLLALLLVVAGVIGSFWLERYKSLLQKQQATNSLYIPLVLDLMKDFEALHDLGQHTLDDLAIQCLALAQWGNKLVVTPVETIDFKLPTDETCREEPMRLSDGTVLTFGQLLAAAAPDSFTNELANSKAFWTDKTLYSALKGFISDLFTCYAMEPDKRGTYLSVIARDILDDLCVRYVPGSRQEYLNQVNALLLKTARTLDINQRSQRRVLEQLVRLLELAGDEIKKYPTNEGLPEVHGVKPEGARRRLTTIHAGALTQLRRALQAI